MKTPRYTHLLHRLLWLLLLWPGTAFASTEAPEAKNPLETLYSLEAMALPHAFDPDTMPYDSTENKLRFYDKLGHWFEAYQYAQDYYGLAAESKSDASGFLDSQQVAFKRHTFINTYVEPEIRHPNWMFWMTNRITKAKNPHKVAPYIILQPEFTPTDTSFTAYTVSLQLTGSADIAGHIGQIERKINEEQLKGLTASSPQGFKEALDEALGQTLSELSEFIGRSFAPPVAIGYEGNILIHGDQINFYEGMAETFTLQSLDRDLQPLDDARVSWQNATKQGSIATVSMQGVNRKEVSLSYRGHTSIITIVRKGDLFDLRSIVKEQLLAVLQPRKAQHQDTLRVRQEALSRIDARLVDQLSLIEAGNLAIVPETTQERQALFDSPLLITDSSTFQEEPKRTAGFALLREKKGLEAQVRKRLNILAFVDLVVDQPEALDDLVDAIIRDSGRLLARLIFEQSSQGQEGRVRNIVTDYLNANIEALANSSSVAVTAVPLQLPVVVVENPPVADASQSLIYINPLIPMSTEEKAALTREVNDYLVAMGEKVFVNISYSQDISGDSYKSRTSAGRPLGLPENYDYINIDYINIPGSVMKQLFLHSSKKIRKPADQHQTMSQLIKGLFTESLMSFDEFYISVATDLQESGELRQHIEDIRRIYEYLENCHNEGWPAYKEDGMVPYCLWQNAEQWPIPFTAGIIDGVYVEVEGIISIDETLQAIKENVGSFIYAYSIAYWDCRQSSYKANQADFEEVISRLKELEQEEGIIAWLQEKYYDSKAEGLEEELSNCNEVYDLRNDVISFIDFITDREEVEALVWKIGKEVFDYIILLDSQTNEAYYEYGRIFTFAASFVVPGLGQLSKLKRVKTLLRGVHTIIKEGKWRQLTNKWDELLQLGTKWSRYRNLSKLEQNALSKIDNWPDEVLRRLDEDISANQKLIAIFNKPGGTDAWRKMDKLGADEALRRNPGAVDALAKKDAGEVVPAPSTYLDAEYIANHLARFDEGAVRFTSRKAFNKYGTLGPDGGFTLPKSELDRLLNETGGNLRKVEEKLGLDYGYLDGDDTMIVLIEKQDLNGLRMPSGNEGGANSFWLPGGKTSGGVPEAVMDFSGKPSFSEINLN